MAGKKRGRKKKGSNIGQTARDITAGAIGLGVGAAVSSEVSAAVPTTNADITRARASVDRSVATGLSLTGLGLTVKGAGAVIGETKKLSKKKKRTKRR